MLITNDVTTRREDLLEVIADMSPDETPLLSMLGTSTAKGTLHEWTEDYISRPTAVSYTYEGQAATYSALTQPARRQNITAIITETFRVSGTERAVTQVGGDPMDYQASKALKNWKLQAEFTVMRGTAMVSGVSGTARQMSGLVGVITTLATARNSGTSLSETEFQDMVQDSVTQGGTLNCFDLVLVPFGLKRKIDSFTAGATKYVDSTDKRLTLPVQIYETSGGVHRIMYHPDVNNGGGTTAFLGIKEDAFKIAYLRKPFKELLAKDGDRENGQIVGEFTVEYLGERTSVFRSGYNLTG